MYLNRKQSAFTLIELLVVIAIIGTLASISIVSLNSARMRTRDAKRVADVRNIGVALEMYFGDMGRYPYTSEWASWTNIMSTSTLSGSIVTTTYMRIPEVPTPKDGNCTIAQNLYSYTGNADGSSYALSFCLGNVVGSYLEGVKCLTPNGVMNSACAP